MGLWGKGEQSGNFYEGWKKVLFGNSYYLSVCKEREKANFKIFDAEVYFLGNHADSPFWNVICISF